MVDHPQVILKKRDKLESEINTYKGAQINCFLEGTKAKSRYEAKLAQYQTWKKENNIEGIRF